MRISTTHEAERRGVTGGRLRADLRSQIEAGRFAGGEFLPTVRELSKQYGVARKTVNRALKALESEGLVSAEPRQGYRVLARAGDPDRGCPIAFITERGPNPFDWHHFLQALRSGLQTAVHKRGWSLLALGSEDRSAKEMMRQLGGARTCGLVLDAVQPDLLEAARKAGLPVVVVDSWYEDTPVDTIIQDSYLGGLLAATHLVNRGHRRIAWLGAVNDEMHTMLRLSGVRSGLERAGLELTREQTVAWTAGDGRERARELLSGPRRPDAILALWRNVAVELVEVALELGVRPGKDFEMVGWMTESDLTEGKPVFAGTCAQPSIVWSPERMADLAVDRLDALRRNPTLPPVRTCVPVELRVPENVSAQAK